MTSIIKLQPLSGAMDEGPLCYILQVDEFRFMLDAGWNEEFDQEHIELLKAQIPTVDAVLLTYPDIYHLGALPHLVGKCGLNCPIYATIPVYKMGQMFMYDLYQSRHNTEEFEVFTLDDVDAAFDKIIQLKFSQTVSLRGKGHGLQITPLPAGHMIGGTLWKIVKDGEEEIVYAVDYNHKKERHLNGCILESISRPSLLITDTYNSLYSQARRKQRDEQLMTNILLTMRNGGNVLVAVDAAGRVLELAHLLDQLWRTPDSGLMAYNLALLNNVSYNVVEFAKSQVEWMSDKIMRSFEDNRNNPFQFKHMQLCHSLAELAKVPQPKVVLASTPDLQAGFSRELFVSWCGDPKNSIILTSRTSPGTLTRWLIDNPLQKDIKLKVSKRVRLEGAELEDYLKVEREKELERKQKQAELEKEEKESSDESEDEMDVDSAPYLSQSRSGKHDLMSKSESKSRSGFFKHAKKSYPMFPCEETRLKWDDYGELIKPEDFLFVDVVANEEERQETMETEEEPVQDISEVPTKCVQSEVDITINATVSFIDFEGRSDGESVKKILAQIRPRQLILVHGSADATHALATHCMSTGIVQGKVYTPDVKEVIDATTESHIYQVKLREALVSSLDFCPAKDCELAWIDAVVDMTHFKADTSFMYEPEEGEVTETDGVNKGKKKLTVSDSKQSSDDLLPTLEPVAQVQMSSHSAVFINEPKLSDFKQVLVKNGIQAEFVAGSLICNGTVAVKRSEAGKLQLEGTLSDDYYTIRELLYEQYAII